MRKRTFWLIILLVVLLAASELRWWIPSFHAHRSYTASAMLLVEKVPPSLVFHPEPDDFEAFLKTQAALIKSQPVLKRALSQLTMIVKMDLIQEVDPVDWLEQNLGIETEGQIIRVSLNSDSRHVATMVNAVAEAYMREVVDRQREDQRRKIEKLQQIYGNYQMSLKYLRKRFNDIEESKNRKCDKAEIQDEIENAGYATRRIGREIERLKVEMDAPPRVRLIQFAELP